MPPSTKRHRTSEPRSPSQSGLARLHHDPLDQEPDTTELLNEPLPRRMSNTPPPPASATFPGCVGTRTIQPPPPPQPMVVPQLSEDGIRKIIGILQNPDLLTHTIQSGGLTYQDACTRYAQFVKEGLILTGMMPRR